MFSVSALTRPPIASAATSFLFASRVYIRPRPAEDRHQLIDRRAGERQPCE